ncbi:MBL fold metallo-hydrolase [Candidatus Tenderia electrophaga]|jgi:phosphoribosyl 1,2-cyclic phosphodiesterase|uniref:MBL fold metallo-hydrolase n=1 Tax=Candidatus Tenderia electrophaga TaxID=1748243 RepID=A0A0S2TB75_9GAMM|nr:MBL fold metallo-hydrolase [Candidatus Tenderia electrophaga]
MRFASLGSGSRGNGTLVEAGATLVLLDCGFSIAQVEARMARLGKTPADLSAIVVTHEHGDHIKGVGPLARRYQIPVWMTPGTARHRRLGALPQLCHFNSHSRFAIDDLELSPYPVPHDAREPAQFVFGDGKVRIGILTDVGCWTPHIEEQLSRCDALILECNHDSDLLLHGGYPAALKQRVGGRHGHLSNRQAADLLGRLNTGKLQHLIAAHLSEENNQPQLARDALAAVLGCSGDWIGVADQEQGLAWREVV